MKQNKLTKAMALMLSFVMITSVFVGNTLSRYVTSVSSTDSARVAVWGINGGENEMNLFDTKYLVAGKKIAESNNKTDKIIAPGAAGEAEFNIINFEQDVPPEVAYEVSISLDDSEMNAAIKNNPSIQWKLDNGAFGTWDQLKTSILSLAGNESGKHTYAPGEFATAFQGTQTHKIAWQWVMDNSNNTMDTEMGNAALDGEIKAVVKVSITAQQIDDLVTNANMLEGANQVVNLQDIQTLSFRSASDIANFQRVEVNGQPLTEGTDYTKTSGSTIITLTETYLSKLTADRYVINIVSSDMTASTVFEVVDELVVSDVLSENSWETISKVVKSGKAKDYWEVGEITTVDFYGDDYEVAIAGIDHDGKNTVTFVFTETLGTGIMNYEMTNNGGWNNSVMRKEIMNSLLGYLEISDLIKEVEKHTIKGYADGQVDDSIYDLISTNDKLFLLSYTEVFGDNESLNWDTFNEGTQYEYFKTASNRKINCNWWLRTPGIQFDSDFYYIYINGGENFDCADNEYNIVPAFVIG